MSDDNLTLLEEQGHKYVIAAKLRSMPTALKEKILQKDPSFEVDLLINYYDDFIKNKIELEEMLSSLNKLSKFDKNNSHWSCLLTWFVRNISPTRNSIPYQ